MSDSKQLPKPTLAERSRREFLDSVKGVALAAPAVTVLLTASSAMAVQYCKDGTPQPCN